MIFYLMKICELYLFDLSKQNGHQFQNGRTFYDGYGQKEVMELEDTASFLLGKSAVWVVRKLIA